LRAVPAPQGVEYGPTFEPARESKIRAGESDVKGSGARGVTGLDATDGGPGPIAFEATTVKVYGVPFVNPDTTHDSGPLVQLHVPPGDPVTVYPVIGAPLVGADHDTVT